MNTKHVHRLYDAEVYFTIRITKREEWAMSVIPRTCSDEILNTEWSKTECGSEAGISRNE